MHFRKKENSWSIKAGTVMKELYRLVLRFIKAIDAAWEKNEFSKDIRFCRFPSGCCDDSCDLLDKYGYFTQQVAGTYRDGEFEYIKELLYDKSIIIDITGRSV